MNGGKGGFSLTQVTHGGHSSSVTDYGKDLQDLMDKNFDFNKTETASCVPLCTAVADLKSLEHVTMGMKASRMDEVFPQLWKIYELVLVLACTSVSNERAFSAMKFIKSKLRSKMGEGFLDDELFIFMEKKLLSWDTFSVDDVINLFEDLYRSIDEDGIRTTDRRLELSRTVRYFSNGR